MRYLLSHWRGTLSLKTSLWVNMIGLLVALSYLEWIVLSRLSSTPSILIRASLISLFFTRLVIFPWQLIGLFRAIEIDYFEYKNVLRTRGLQLFALLTVVFTLLYILSIIQGALSNQAQIERYSRPKAKVAFKLKVSKDNKQLSIHGGLDIGITEASKIILASNPEIRSVILNSGGGQIYEGRGLSKLFTTHKLDTYVLAECSSACITAYIGGEHRYLSKTGKLGFHQYKFDASQTGLIIPFFNIRAEQEKDIELLKARGVSSTFLTKMFRQPANQIWFPDQQILLDAKIVHKLISEQP